VRHHDSAKPPESLPAASGYRFALIVSRFNESVTRALRDGARAALLEAGAAETDVEEMWVPGAFELPQAARCAAETARYDAIVCLGCVIRGETPHFEYISSAVAHGIMDAAGETGVPIAFGVLTTDTQAQAEERAGEGPDNKGREAAAAAIEMAVLFGRWAGAGTDRAAGRRFRIRGRRMNGIEYTPNAPMSA
jgi:6,7-dimethyl-8-ribityllumazine synthase